MNPLRKLSCHSSESRNPVFILILIILSLLLTANLSYSGSLEDELISAADSGDTAKVRALIEKDVDVNAKGDGGRTALMGAALIGNTETVKLLIEKGADINAKDNKGKTALISPAFLGRTETVKLLIEKGADVNAKTTKGKTALMLAIIIGNTETVKLLIEKGADINVKDEDGKTALMLAKEKWNNKETDTLLSPSYLSAIEAMEKRKDEIVRLLEEEQQKGEMESKSSITSSKEEQIETPAISYGNYYALVIGNNNYNSFPKLVTAVNDAKSVGELLKNDYGYEVQQLFNASRSDILIALSEYRKTLTEKDNLLIYYAGHGWLDTDADEGYWLPIDAEQDNNVAWVSNSDVTASLKAIGAKHVLVVADSCFSGKMVRGIKVQTKSPDHFARLASKKARTVLTSGGIEPVSDAGKDGHSVFAAEFINALKENSGIIDCTELFILIRKPIMLNSDQTPEYSDIRKAGHDGGDFLFIRK